METASSSTKKWYISFDTTASEIQETAGRILTIVSLLVAMLGFVISGNVEWISLELKSELVLNFKILISFIPVLILIYGYRITLYGMLEDKKGNKARIESGLSSWLAGFLLIVQISIFFIVTMIVVGLWTDGGTI